MPFKSIVFSLFDWQTILFVVALLGIMFSITYFLEREKIRDYIQEIGGEIISIKYIDRIFLRAYHRKYSVTWKDKNGRIVNAKCIISLWNISNYYDEKTIDNDHSI